MESTSSNAPKAALSKANRALRAGRLNEAVTEFSRLVDQNPTKTAYCVGYLESLLLAGNWEQALTLAQATAASKPRSASVRALLGNALLRAGYLEAAAVAYDAALRLDPKEYNALLGKANLGLILGGVPYLDRLLEGAIQQRPTCNRAYSLMASYYQATGRPHLAAKAMKRFLELQPISAVDHLMVKTLPGMEALLTTLGLATPFAVKTLASKTETDLLTTPTHSFIQVYLNGQGPFTMVFDTGGSFVVMLDSAIAEKLQLHPVSNTMALGVGGEADTTTAILDRLTIGALTAETVPAIVYDMTATAQKLGTPVHGVFGAGLLQNEVVELDYQRRKLIVRVCNQFSQPADYLQEPSKSAEPVIRVPFILLGDAKIVIPVWSHGTRRWGVLDTGAAMNIFSARFVKTTFPVESITKQVMMTAGIGNDTDGAEVLIGPELTFCIGGKEFHQKQTIGMNFLDRDLSPILGVEIDLIVGNPVIQTAQKLIIDYPNQMLELVIGIQQ